MTGSERRVAVISVVVLGLLAALLLFGRAREELAPEPLAAWVAFEVADEGVARTGRVEIATGVPFLLHAVLEARDWRDRPVYYTDAERLELAGEPVPAESLRRWNRPLDARVLWFTVEGAAPYVEVGSLDELAEVGFSEVFRSEWGQGWSIPGSVLSAAARSLRIRSDLPLTEFGTQRYHTRVELYGADSLLRPVARFRSPGAAALPDGAEDFPTVVARLDGALGPPSAFFSLSQVEPAAAAGDPVRLRLREWTRRRLVFQRAALLVEMLEALGTEWGELVWEAAEPSVAAWTGEGVLIRVGARVVLTYRDLGAAGVLDEEDLVLDFDRGARLLRLGDVFEGDGLVERARPSPAGVEP